MRRGLRILLRLAAAGAVLAIAFAAFGVWRWTQPAPSFREGDIIFQT
jgi:hypothetical protein